MMEFDLNEVADYNGKDGKPVYIVYEGKVYDVSESKLWKGGSHMRRHAAGADLSGDFSAAPHGVEVFERYPQVGVIKKAEEKAEPDEAMPEFVAAMLKRFPFLRRHLHPMTVHFPIVFCMAAPFFTLLYLLTGVKSFETTATHCLAAALLTTPAIILTGLFTWWLNYMAKPVHAVTIKLVTSVVLFFVLLITFTWRMSNPAILDTLSAQGLAYFLLVLSLAPLVSVIGWYGAKLTFPYEKE